MKNLLFFLLIIFLLTQKGFSLEFYTQDDVNSAKESAFALYKVNKEDEALKILEEIPKKYKTEEMYLVLSNILEDKGDIPGAIKNLNYVIQLNPKSYKAYYNLGLLAIQKNDINLATLNFKKAIKYKNDFAPSNYNLALCYFRKNNLKLAKKYFIKAISYDAKNKDYYYNLALTYKALKNEKEAQKVLDTYNKMLGNI